MSSGVFITGTDTGIGKTRFTLALMDELKKQGHKVSGMKPIASGATLLNGKLINDDARLIMEHCSETIEYELINPEVFELPTSPNIAANRENVKVNLEKVLSCYKTLVSNCETIVVEGIGGWKVPISDDLRLADLAREFNLPVVLVVGLKLGCINHAILTADAIKADGLRLKGWVSNHIDKDYSCVEETISTINAALDCPCIAKLPFGINFESNNLLESVAGEFSEFLNL